MKDRRYHPRPSVPCFRGPNRCFYGHSPFHIFPPIPRPPLQPSAFAEPRSAYFFPHRPVSFRKEGNLYHCLSDNERNYRLRYESSANFVPPPPALPPPPSCQPPPPPLLPHPIPVSRSCVLPLPPQFISPPWLLSKPLSRTNNIESHTHPVSTKLFQNDSEIAYKQARGYNGLGAGFQFGEPNRCEGEKLRTRQPGSFKRRSLGRGGCGGRTSPVGHRPTLSCEDPTLKYPGIFRVSQSHVKRLGLSDGPQMCSTHTLIAQSGKAVPGVAQQYSLDSMACPNGTTFYHSTLDLPVSSASFPRVSSSSLPNSYYRWPGDEGDSATEKATSIDDEAKRQSGLGPAREMHIRKTGQICHSSCADTSMTDKEQKQHADEQKPHGDGEEEVEVAPPLLHHYQMISEHGETMGNIHTTEGNSKASESDLEFALSGESIRRRPAALSLFSTGAFSVAPANARQYGQQRPGTESAGLIQPCATQRYDGLYDNEDVKREKVVENKSPPNTACLLEGMTMENRLTSSGSSSDKVASDDTKAKRRSKAEQIKRQRRAKRFRAMLSKLANHSKSLKQNPKRPLEGTAKFNSETGWNSLVEVTRLAQPDTTDLNGRDDRVAGTSNSNSRVPVNVSMGISPSNLWKNHERAFPHNVESHDAASDTSKLPFTLRKKPTHFRESVPMLRRFCELFKKLDRKQGGDSESPVGLPTAVPQVDKNCNLTADVCLNGVVCHSLHCCSGSGTGAIIKIHNLPADRATTRRKRHSSPLNSIVAGKMHRRSSGDRIDVKHTPFGATTSCDLQTIIEGKLGEAAAPKNYPVALIRCGGAGRTAQQEGLYFISNCLNAAS